MKLTELIQKLEKYKQEHGDVILFAEVDTGRETYLARAEPSVVRKYNNALRKTVYVLETGG